MHILLIEDNKNIGNNIKKYLESEGYPTELVQNGNDGIHKAQKNNYDLIILDIMLPGLDGISICKKLRETKETPIIMTTSKGQLEDKKEGFDCGADDYLVKPFDLDELVLRIKAVTKRSYNFDKFIWGNIEVFIDKQEVIKKGKKIKLTLKEFELLEYLIKNYGISVSRTNIIEHLWGGDSIFEGDNKLDVYISNLRKKLSKNFIQTIKGFGYKIDKG